MLEQWQWLLDWSIQLFYCCAMLVIKEMSHFLGHLCRSLHSCCILCSIGGSNPLGSKVLPMHQTRQSSSEASTAGQRSRERVRLLCTERWIWMCADPEWRLFGTTVHKHKHTFMSNNKQYTNSKAVMCPVKINCSHKFQTKLFYHPEEASWTYIWITFNSVWLVSKNVLI